ncbi:MAG: hypothetical protein JNM68_06870 [Dinghuibacter sp.]|nr:hypothetical protein [Dinghuibacter sp.]
MKKINQKLLGLAFVFLINPYSAKTFCQVVKLKVIDQENKRPIENAEVQCFRLPDSIVTGRLKTNNLGEIKYSGSSPAKFCLVVNSHGYRQELVYITFREFEPGNRIYTSVALKKL